MSELTALEQELVEMIMDECNVFDDPEELSSDSPIIGDESPFGLDSLDAVEVVVAVQKKYGVRIGNQETSRQVFRSLKTLADYIEANKA